MEKFLWGAATAAHQIEGAYDEDGKVPSIWDELTEGKISNGENARVACDHYHRYKEDVALMKELGLNSYRFSLSWARIIINENGDVNPKGIDFYRNLCDELNANGIEPLCTLYHWDLPMWAYRAGGWKNPKIIEWFCRYVDVMTKALDGKAKYFITFNEPQYFIGVGCFAGLHAPFEKNDIATIKVMSRHVMLAHGEAVKIIRKNVKGAIVGMAPNHSCFAPETDTTEGVEEARSRSFNLDHLMFSTAWWSDPMVLGVVPDLLKDTITQEDVKTICQSLDFYGYNVYSAMNYSPFAPKKRNNPTFGAPRTQTGWLVSPQIMYYAPKFLYERYRLPILITENGMSNCDWVMRDGKVHDPQRVDYLHGYIKELMRAKNEVPVIGYQYWSLMDNFEWTNGYSSRFGLIFVDFATQKRTWKDSAYFYRDIIQSNGENL